MASGDAIAIISSDKWSIWCILITRTRLGSKQNAVCVQILVQTKCCSLQKPPRQFGTPQLAVIGNVRRRRPAENSWQQQQRIRSNSDSLVLYALYFFLVLGLRCSPCLAMLLRGAKRRTEPQQMACNFTSTSHLVTRRCARRATHHTSSAHYSLILTRPGPSYIAVIVVTYLMVLHAGSVGAQWVLSGCSRGAPGVHVREIIIFSEEGGKQSAWLPASSRFSLSLSPSLPTSNPSQTVSCTSKQVGPFPTNFFRMYAVYKQQTRPVRRSVSCPPSTFLR